MDLNGDGVADVILAARHQACLMGISGQDGRLLWIAARGHDLSQPVSNELARWQQGVVSGVVATPTPCGDVDGDGVTDFVALMADEQAEGAVDRWLESISGKTGRTLWRRELEDHLFAARAGLDVPECFRWFRGSGAASSRIGDDATHSNADVLKRDSPRLERTGYFHHVPSPAMLVSWHPGQTQPPQLTILAGSHVLAFDTTTGEPIGMPLDCGLTPGRNPIVADVDGDGADELVLMQELASPSIAAGPGKTSSVRIGVLSLAGRRLLWSQDIQAEWPRVDWPLFPIAAPQWPVIEDLDRDGNAELIVPNGTSRSSANPFANEAWGEIEVLDGITGKSRWKRRLKTMDQQVDHLLVGPDVDGDGVADVFASTLWSPNFDLYVDALSGRDGKTIWVGRQTLRRTNESAHYRLSPPLWWHAGRDGWPQLVVPVNPVERTPKEPLVCVFSAGSGELNRIGSNLIEFQTIDADGDGTEDLFALKNDSPVSMDAGGTLVCFRGEGRELWKSIGSIWSATADLDDDGIRDLTRAWPDGTVIAASGRDGQTLWKVRMPEVDLHHLQVIPAVPRQDGFLGPGHLVDELLSYHASEDGGRAATLPGDFDGDGTTDLLVWVSNMGRDRPTPLLFALSGRSGRRLWTSEIKARMLAGVHALDIRDLDGDGRAEVIWVGASDWGFPEPRPVNIHQKQLELIVFSGRNGRMVWHEPLTSRYGLTPQGPTLPYDLDQGWVAISYGDLNADGVLDIIVPGEAKIDGANSREELRVLSGMTGDLLWRHPLPPALEHAPSPPRLAAIGGRRFGRRPASRAARAKF